VSRKNFQPLLSGGRFGFRFLFWEKNLQYVDGPQERAGVERLRMLLLKNVKACCVALEAGVGEIEVIRAPQRLNIARQRRGKALLPDYRIVNLARRHVKRSREQSEGHHRSPRLHFRRGHWRRWSDRRIWVKWCLVGDPDLGFLNTLTSSRGDAMTDDDFAKRRKQHDEETLIRSEQRLQEIGFSQPELFGVPLGDWVATNCHVRIRVDEGEWEIHIHLPGNSTATRIGAAWVSARTGKLHGLTEAEIATTLERLRLEAEERRQKAEVEPRITLAGTVFEFEDGTWAVTLNDFISDMDEVSSVQTFDNKEKAEAFAAEVRKAREKHELP
jgi:hypothetical protein